MICLNGFTEARRSSRVPRLLIQVVILEQVLLRKRFVARLRDRSPKLIQVRSLRRPLGIILKLLPKLRRRWWRSRRIWAVCATVGVIQTRNSNWTCPLKAPDSSKKELSSKLMWSSTWTPWSATTKNSTKPRKLPNVCYKRKKVNPR